MTGRDKDYHVERARIELDAAYRADGSKAALAHLRLCSMHMALAREAPLTISSGAETELNWVESSARLGERCLGGCDSMAGSTGFADAPEILSIAPAAKSAAA